MDRLDAYDVPVWLVNTGWTGGPYGVGERMNITHTRNMVRAALNGEPRDVPTVEDPVFRVAVPTEVPGVPDEILSPARHVAGSGRVRRGGAPDRRACSTRTSRPTPTA